MLEKIRRWASALKQEIVVLSYAVRDPRTPWYARALGWGIIAYALSPIDLIPDFIPVLGFVDELIILPLGLWALRRLIPAAVVAEYRARQSALPQQHSQLAGAFIVVGLWVILVAVVWITWSGNWIF